MKRGLLILAPMGTGKTKWISNLSEEDQGFFVDGDEILLEQGIENKNYFWYTDGKEQQRTNIVDSFEYTTAQGVSVLYSGNPWLMDTNILILPDSKLRWERVSTRDDFRPSREQFEREDCVYTQYANSGILKTELLFKEIPSAQTLKNIRG